MPARAGIPYPSTGVIRRPDLAKVMTILPFLLGIACSLLCAAIGMALLALTCRSIPTRLALIAPILGAALLMCELLSLSRLGYAIGPLGPALLFSQVVAAAVVLLLLRTRIALSRMLLVVVLPILGASLVAYPLLSLGWNWIGPPNPDLFYYMMHAQRFLDHGFFAVPSLYDVMHNYNPGAWAFFKAPLRGGVRPGTDLLMSLVMSVTHLSSQQVYMPMTFAAVAALIAAIIGLVADATATKLSRWHFGTAFVLASLSSLVALTAVQELLPSVIGEAFCATIVILLGRSRIGDGEGWRRGIPLGLATAGLLVSYPEIVPMLAMGLGGCLAIAWRRREHFATSARAFLDMALIAGVVILVALNTHILNPLMVDLEAFNANLAGNQGTDRFPWFLIPSGPANLWGIFAVGHYPSQPFLDIAIVAGVLLTGFVLWRALVLAARGEKAATIFVVLFAFGAYLCFKEKGFSTYKVAMYIQPFSVATLSIVIAPILMQCWEKARARSASAIGVLTLFGLMLVLMARSQQYYVTQSIDARSNRDGGFVNIPHASTDHIMDKLGQVQGVISNARVISDSNNFVLSELEQLSLRTDLLVFPNWEPQQINGLKTYFPGSTFFQGLMNEGLSLGAVRNAAFSSERFPPVPSIQFVVDRRDQRVGKRPDFVLVTGPDVTVINKSRHWSDRAFSLIPYENVHNDLVAIRTSEWYSEFMLKSQADEMSADGDFAPVGRYELFEVINPSPDMRINVAYTRTIEPLGLKTVPLSPIKVYGASVATLNPVGFGSLRMTTGKLRPLILKGHSYILVDFGIAPFTFADHKSWLMRFYGRNVHLDPRPLAGFVRNISAVSRRGLGKAPAVLTSFPKDLVDSTVSYSGIYEDGWIDRAAMVILREPRDSKLFCLSADAPVRDAIISVAIDGKAFAATRSDGKTIEIIRRMSADGKAHVLRITSTGEKPTSAQDGRNISIRLHTIGFTTSCQTGRVTSPH